MMALRNLTAIEAHQHRSLRVLASPSRSRLNNLDAIRLIAALTVLVGHSWPLTGRPHPPSIAGLPIFTLAVYVFFAVSGYLIAVSWTNSKSITGFLRRRIFRIFPALLLVIFLTTFLIGPLTTNLSTQEYFAAAQTWTYLTNVTLVATYDLPGVFVDHPRTAVNGSLWTIGPEFICYLGILAIGLAAQLISPRIRRHSPLVITAVIGMGLATTAIVAPENSAVASSAAAMTFFSIGATLSHVNPKKLLPLWPVAVLIPAWIVGAALLPESALVLAYITLPYSILALGLRSTPVIRHAGRFGDFSYGIYLWGYPVQQVVFGTFPRLPLWLDILMVAGVTWVAAVLSWHLVERHALDFARRTRELVT